MTPDLATGTLTDIGRQLARRHIGAEELARLQLDRIAALNAGIGALSDVLAETAITEAKAVDRARERGRPLGPLAGIPVASKDIIDTTPAVCSAGLPFLRDRRPKCDAEVVRRLRRAGAVIVGVTETDPGAFGVRTASVTHPQAPTLTVGGSSGGSGAALAAGFCFATLGTDTGGSIRIPAACCQIVGLKPTRTRVSTEGVMPLVWSLDHVGPMTRSARDLAAVQAVLDPRFAHTATRKRRWAVGFDPRYAADASPLAAKAIERTLKAARAAHIGVREVRMPAPDDILDVHLVVFCAESAAYHFQAYPDRRNDYPAGPRHLLSMARSHTGYEYVQAMRQRAEITARMQALYDDVDAIIVPTLPVEPPPKKAEQVEVAGRPVDFTWALIRYTCLFNQTGNPVVSLPAVAKAPGVGASVQVVGPLDRDADTIALAVKLEAALGLAIDRRLSV
ncbi:MAG: amidase [Alphaproteobacteria bacterium]|nr:amidase [Alphaproteobacteria bacterium]